MTELKHCKENFYLLLHFNIKVSSYILYESKNKKDMSKNLYRKEQKKDTAELPLSKPELLMRQ